MTSGRRGLGRSRALRIHTHAPTMTSTNDALITCRLCQRGPRPAARLRMWTPSGPEMRTLTWCKMCENKNTRNPRRVQAYREFLLEEWDGETTTQCPTCRLFHPDVFFPYTLMSGGRVIARRRRCLDCRGKEYKHGIEVCKQGLASASAFDVTEQWIQAATGRPIAQWKQAEHHAQCVLMRELAGVPHHAQYAPGGMKINNPEQERLWNARVQRYVTQYVPSANSWRAWHCG